MRVNDRVKKFDEQRNSLKVGDLIQNLLSEIQSKVSVGSKKLERFKKQYDKEFRTEFTYQDFDGTVKSNILNALKGTLTLYSLDLNGQVIVDLAGILERYAVLYIVQLFRSVSTRQNMIREILEKEFLDKAARYLIRLGIWDMEDESLVLNLKKARDGIAHKNPELVSKKLHNGKQVSVLEIDIIMSKKDVLPYIITTIRLLHKLMYRFLSRTDRGIVAQLMLDGKIKSVDEFLK